jgi:serine/threonine protein kinase
MMGLDTAKSVGDYDLLEKIAEGGMGAIYRGRHRESGAIVAIKVMAPHLTKNPLLLKRFEQEFRAASRLDHPNIVRALDYSDNGNRPYLVMEFVEGESLGQKLEREGRMSEAEAIRLIAQVAQGLHRAHKQNLVHRDVKPDNILVTADGIAKLADLGLVKETETDLNLTRTGRGLGTPHFMAPEQFRNAKNADVRCDVYSLGATLYQMVTGELPFRSNGPLDAWMKKIQNDLVPPRQIVPELSERVDRAIRRAMSADPEKRPASCREFIEELTGKSTRRLPSVDGGTPQQELLWYLVYKDETGMPHTVKGTAAAIRRSFRDGLLGDASNVRASRSKAGPFEPLLGYPEFRDLGMEAASLSVAKAPSSSPAAAPTEGTSPTQPQLKRELAPPPSPPAALPTVPPKPLITLKDIPPSTNWEALKWVFFFGLLFLTAIISFWFFQR